MQQRCRGKLTRISGLLASVGASSRAGDERIVIGVVGAHQEAAGFLAPGDRRQAGSPRYASRRENKNNQVFTTAWRRARPFGFRQRSGQGRQDSKPSGVVLALHRRLVTLGMKLSSGQQDRRLRRRRVELSSQAL